MSRIVVIHQNPNLAKTGGFEHLNRNLYSGSTVNFGISVKNNRLNLDLNKDEKALIENTFNVNMDTKEGLNFYTNEQFNFEISDKVMSWDLQDAKTLLKYGAAIASGILAKDKKEVENPRCQSIFYVYDAEAETDYLSSLNELKGDVMFELTKLKKEEPEKIIIYAKYLFNTFEKYTPAKAFNSLVEYAEKHTKTNKTLDQLLKVLNLPFEDIELTVIVQTAINSGILSKNKQGNYFNKESMTDYGKNIEDIKLYLKMNPDELGEGKSTDKVYAIRRQLKQ